MIVMRIHGGLGNQLFQYAVGYRLAADRQCGLKLDVRSFEKDTLRRFALPQLLPELQIARLSDLREFRTPVGIHPRLRHLWSALPISKGYVAERQVAFDPKILELGRSAYLDGYWQTERYFLERSVALRGMLQPRLALGDRYLSAAARMNAPGTVSVHVRRGDYVSSAANVLYHGPCEPAWYNRALALLRAKRDISTAFVFSDDIAWAKANIALDVDTFFVEPDSTAPECVDLLLMAACEHHVIANSSFSWWGAWIGEKQSSVVVAPEKWFGPTGPRDTVDICPPRWIRVS